MVEVFESVLRSRAFGTGAAALMVTVSASYVLGMSGVANATTSTDVSLPSTMNIWAAGLSSAPSGVLPQAIGVGPGDTVTLGNAGGTWSCNSPFGGPGNQQGPDGNGVTGQNCDPPLDMPADGGLSGIYDGSRDQFITGVFLASSGQPATPPSRLDFTDGSGLGHSFTSLAPQLGQMFFIGDGLTGTGSGSAQQFTAPAGAATLYLGYTDAPTAYGDNQGAVTATVQVTSNANTAPVVNAGADASGTTGSAIAVDGSVSDSDGDPVSAAWTIDGSSCTFANASQAATTVTCATAGTYTATLTGNDGTNAPVSDTATVTVTSPPPSNSPPTVDAGPAVLANLNAPVTLNGSASDPDAGDSTTVQWTSDSPSCTFASPSQPVTAVQCSATGAHNATLTATDSHGATSSASTSVRVRYAPAPEVVRIVRPLPHGTGMLGFDCANKTDGVGDDVDVLSFRGNSQQGVVVHDGSVSPEVDFSGLPEGSYTFSCMQQGGLTVSSTVYLGTRPVVHFTATCSKYVMTKGIYKGRARCKLNNYWSGTRMVAWAKDSFGHWHKYALARFQVKTVYLPAPVGSHKVFVYRQVGSAKKLVYSRYVVR